MRALLIECVYVYSRSDVDRFSHVEVADAIVRGVCKGCGINGNKGNSNEMVYDLINKGVVPRKSLILEPPKIKEEFYLPYILGYFDGDGSIFQTKNKEFGINFVGTKETLEWIKRTLKMNNPLEQKNNANGNNYYIRCGGIQKQYFIMKQLYDSCPSIYLERKHTIYKNLETVVLSRNAK